MRIAILASGKGSNLRVLLEQAASGRLKAEPCLVLCNNPEAGAVEQARKYGVPCWCKNHQGMERGAFDAEMLEAMNKAGVQGVVLAGYMRLLSASFIRAYQGRIINVHPALLPSFPGASGLRDALDYRVRLAGCTVHFVEEAMDSGAVIIQAALPVLENDTTESLASRVHALEHRILPQATQWLAQGRLSRPNEAERPDQSGRAVRLAPPAPGSLAATPPPPPFPCLISPELEEF
ncbi:MAG: phosphoribosylglycinamide formyltransferase [Deltaproteobacteria bacterium]|nr:phosphoribosylglycinamide formyltransferase [Deltaproteobacteria bacterium]